MINSINLMLLRNAEFLQFMNNFLSLLESNDVALLNVVSQHAALKSKIREIEELFKTSRASGYTKDLTLDDETRDRYILGLSNVIDGYKYYFEESKATAANLLAENLKLYGSGIYKFNYVAETATLTELVRDWESKPELTAALTTLNLTDWKNALKAANIAFNEKYLARTQEYGAASPETLKGKRDESMTAYYELRKFIEAYATIDSENPLYPKTINELNALIEQYNTILDSRAVSGDDTNGGDSNEGTPGEGDDITPSPLP